uniref:Uncharacterized protein n=1 Tax=Picea sitchensis TaxID=3332 RepID=B8LM23_PICSI|nr:unknown [Picea sitchensis]
MAIDMFTNANGSFQNPQGNSSPSISTRDVGPSVRIMRINIEGISAAKSVCMDLYIIIYL